MCIGTLWVYVWGVFQWRMSNCESCQTATIFKTVWDLEKSRKVRQSLWTLWKFRFCFAFFVLCINMKVVKKMKHIICIYLYKTKLQNISHTPHRFKTKISTAIYSQIEDVILEYSTFKLYMRLYFYLYWIWDVIIFWFYNLFSSRFLLSWKVLVNL